MRRIIANCTIATPLGNSARRGEEMRELRIVRDAFILIEDDTILATGEMKDIEK